MPSNPSSPGSFEEAMAKQEVYENVINVIRASPSANVLWEWRGFGMLGWYATETRRKLEKLLGPAMYNELVGEKTKLLTSDIVDRITNKMVETNHRVHSLLSDIFEDPAAVELEVSSGAKKKLNDVVRDPESEDAKLLAWYYNKMAKAAPDMKERVFAHVKNSTEAGLLSKLMKARALYEQLVADAGNFDIGMAGAMTPDPNTQIGALEIQLKEAQTDESTANSEVTRLTSGAAAATVNVTGYLEQAKQARTEQRELKGKIAALEQKRAKVKSMLDELDIALADLGPASMPTAPSVTRAAELNKTNAKTYLTAISFPPIVTGFPAANAHELLSDDAMKARLDELVASAAKGGAQKPTSKEALERLIRQDHADRLKSMTPEQQQAFLRTMHDIVSKSSSGETSASDSEKKKEEGPKKFLGSTWLHSLGGNNLYNWWWNLDAEGKKKPEEPKKSSESWWTSFKKYMNDDSKNFLGMDVPKKK